MRKVLFKRWVPLQQIQVTEISKQPVPGTGCFESDFLNQGKFHQWANNFDETKNGIGNYTVALVEISDGTIEEVFPENLKFIS